MLQQLKTWKVRELVQNRKLENKKEMDKMNVIMLSISENWWSGAEKKI